MSRAVKEHHVGESVEDESAGAEGLKNITTKAAEKKVIKIDGKDLDIVMRATCLQRQQAIDLITKADGDIKKALESYVNQ